MKLPRTVLRTKAIFLIFLELTMQKLYSAVITDPLDRVVISLVIADVREAKMSSARVARVSTVEEEYLTESSLSLM